MRVYAIEGMIEAFTILGPLSNDGRSTTAEVMLYAHEAIGNSSSTSMEDPPFFQDRDRSTP